MKKTRRPDALARNVRKSTERLLEHLPLETIIDLAALLRSWTQLLSGSTYGAVLDELDQRDLTEKEWLYLEERLKEHPR